MVQSLHAMNAAYPESTAYNKALELLRSQADYVFHEPALHGVYSEPLKAPAYADKMPEIYVEPIGIQKK